MLLNVMCKVGGCYSFVYVGISMASQTEICSSQKTMEQYRLRRWFSHFLSFSKMLLLGSVCTEGNYKGCKDNCSLTHWLGYLAFEQTEADVLTLHFTIQRSVHP